MSICPRAAAIYSWLLVVEQATGDHNHEPRSSKSTNTPVSTADIIASLPTSAGTKRRLEEEEGQRQGQYDPDLVPNSIGSMASPSIEFGGTKWKPVQYLPLHDNAARELPHDVRRLYSQLLDVTMYVGIYPPEMKNRILASQGSPIPDSFWETRQSQAPPQLQTSINYFMETELNELEEIQRKADASHHTGRSEPAWNSFVHSPLLDLALQGYHYRGRPSLSSPGLFDLSRLPGRAVPSLELCTTATLARRFTPPFIPRIRGFSIGESVAAGTNWAASKMVDIILGLDLGSRSLSPAVSDATLTPAFSSALNFQGQASESRGSNPNVTSNLDQIPSKLNDDEARKLRHAIREAVWSQPADLNFVNQTCYLPLTYVPTAISIVTKVPTCSDEEGCSDEKGKIQLGVWTAAWHRRIAALVDLGNSPIVTLPLLLAVGHDWKLFFACDRGDRIEIVGGMNVGNTNSLPGLYQLLVTVRLLADWIEKEYAAWIAKIFIPQKP
ncbi:hypothetical protein NUW58_g698 [Xylaria curta]|uniref:Uncharacterized protein n=1 Tax=Xylaria curta TaxID=42375 RepID=A0ACC1PNC7_9PEZI|nr:hypothetical protein NUW58_g698 [Xylaria curta]